MVINFMEYDVQKFVGIEVVYIVILIRINRVEKQGFFFKISFMLF